ncbi:MAG TPA: hypothetical protein VMV92_41545 [Streptosporangiaceae bacterium]|nr:hypothetical protein [Streptosporangiaceae bacterium]
MAKCGKVCYPAKAAAERAMRRQPGWALGKVPTGVYRCGKCRAWHLTTQVRR